MTPSMTTPQQKNDLIRCQCRGHETVLGAAERPVDNALKCEDLRGVPGTIQMKEGVVI